MNWTLQVLSINSETWLTRAKSSSLLLQVKWRDNSFTPCLSDIRKSAIHCSTLITNWTIENIFDQVIVNFLNSWIVSSFFVDYFLLRLWGARASGGRSAAVRPGQQVRQGCRVAQQTSLSGTFSWWCRHKRRLDDNLNAKRMVPLSFCLWRILPP